MDRIGDDQPCCGVGFLDSLNSRCLTVSFQGVFGGSILLIGPMGTSNFEMFILVIGFNLVA